MSTTEYQDERRANTSSYRRNRHEEPKKRRRIKFNFVEFGEGLDYLFCGIIFVLLIIGVIMMFSASYVVAYYEEHDSYHYLKRQLIFAVLGIIIMLAVSMVDYHQFHRFAPIILGVSYFALLIVLIIPGQGGVKRWIGVGSFGIQASEITKFAVILFLAHWGSLHYKKMRTLKYGIVPAGIILITTDFLLFLEPHYSCIVIVTILTVIMLFISGIDMRWMIIAGALIVILIIVLWVTGSISYAMQRLDGWGQALEYQNDDQWQLTWQTRNSLYAIGSGGLFGLGLGQSRQKYLYLPEPQNDFIFAIICEELGLIGAVIILLIFALLVWRGIIISLRARDRFGKLLGIGLVSQIGLQVVLNILVITDWLPNTGISLPFFSYGGSSLLMLMFEMGLVLSISRSKTDKKAPENALSGGANK